MYEVDKRTRLFTDAITDAEVEELTRFCTKIVLEGHTDLQHPAFRAWVEAVGTTKKDELFDYLTLFPQFTYKVLW